MVEDHTKIVDVDENGETTRIKLHIWDAAGDGNVHDLAHLFVRDVQVGILVYGINSLQSFKNLDTWQEHLEKENRDFILFLVGNKSDLDEQRAVSYAQGAQRKRLAEQCVFFTETSAYTSVDSINALFNEISHAIVRKGCY
jgi:small GTP-binding protein